MSANSLRRWLDQPEFDTLVEVLKSRAFKHQFNALESIRKTEGGKFANYNEAAMSESLAAALETGVIEILEELRKSESALETFTATPD